MLVQGTDGLAGQQVRGERELVHPGQDDVLGGLGYEHPQHSQDPGHPQLHCGYRRLRGDTGWVSALVER